MVLISVSHSGHRLSWPCSRSSTPSTSAPRSAAKLRSSEQKGIGGNFFWRSSPQTPFKNFYVGGIGSVRGFEAATLGPRDIYGNTLGGKRKIVGNAEPISKTTLLKSGMSLLNF